MKQPFILLLLLSTFSCSNYSAGDINGKWSCSIEDQNIELWVSDTLAIGFNIDNQLMNTYKVEYNGRMLTFTFIDHMKTSAPWREEIISLTPLELKTQLQNPGNKQITTYQKISDVTPKISTDWELNWELYEEYMKSKLASS